MDDLVQTRRQHYGDHPSQFVDISTPVDQPIGTIVSYHGGYWRAKYGLELHDPIVEHCVGRGWTVVNTEYRRVEPESTGVWADMSTDVVAAARIARDLSSGPLIALGHSAGGQLALWLAAQRDPAIDAVVALAPVTDLFHADRLASSDHATAELFGAPAAEAPDRYRAASPLHLLPLGVPQLLVHGPLDASVPYESASAYVEAAHAAGDDVTLIDPPDIDHFDVINPEHVVWRHVDGFFEAQRPE